MADVTEDKGDLRQIWTTPKLSKMHSSDAELGMGLPSEGDGFS